MRVLDLFCGAGGCAVGYHRAGANHILGIDNKPQKNYPFDFIQADAFEYAKLHAHKFDFVHASPKCQRYSRATPKHLRPNHEDQLQIIRPILQERAKEWCIENVNLSPINASLMLCGTMFGLKVIRHRYFEFGKTKIFMAPATCNHWLPSAQCKINERPPITDKEFHHMAGNFGNTTYARVASGINWMTRDEMSQAIPPAYTEFIGKQLFPLIS